MLKSIVAGLLALSVTSLSYGHDGSRADGRETGERGDHPALKVFDAQGKSVGPLLAEGSAAGVVLDVNGATILVPIRRVSDSGSQITASQYKWSGKFSDDISFYSSTDCSGPPLIIGDITETLRPSVVVRQGVDATVYIAPDTYSTNITALTYRAGSPAQCYPRVAPSVSEKGWSPESAYSLTQNYPEPLTIHD
ncbi:hypothetical protein PQR02_17705 [Paraburkholderia sediminicola]|uniref:Uncharacterized protein n=1 Tax=Paraburkholderia rhynchosiae TaxID=487049 RepID=A0ACC7N7T5_9BURK